MEETPAISRLWTQLLHGYRALEAWLATHVLRRPPQLPEVVPPVRRTIPLAGTLPRSQDAVVEAPPPPAARAATAAGLGRFLHSQAGKRYVIATSRATGGFGKYRFAVDDEANPWALREMPHPMHHEVIALRELGRRFAIQDEIAQGDRYLVVLPLMAGELTDAVSRLRDVGVRRALGRSMLAQFSEDLVAVHAKHHVHRDVKLAAGLWHSDGRIMLAEFASAQRKDDQQRVAGVCGTSGYMAPEMLFSEDYDEKVDVWSLAMAFTAIHDNRLQRLFALAPRNPDIMVSFSQWRKQLLARPHWLGTLSAGRDRWDEYFAQLASVDDAMCRLVLESMLEPKSRQRADAAEVQRLVRRLHPVGGPAERDLVRALSDLAETDAKRAASLTALRAQISRSGSS